MIVYHGSGVAVKEPRIIKTEIGRDFGYAFYTTDIKEQAIRWAQRKAMMLNRQIQDHRPIEYHPILNSYELDLDMAEDKMNVKKFDGPSREWLEFIILCRGDRNYIHNYDLVIGNIANDNVGETVSYVMQGIMRKEDAIARLRFEKINNQISFNTARAIQCLSYIESIEV